MYNWNKLCEMVDVEMEEILKGHKNHLKCTACIDNCSNCDNEILEERYPQPTAEKREQLEEIVLKILNNFHLKLIVEIGLNNYLLSVIMRDKNLQLNTVYSKGQTRTEALAGLMLQMDLTDEEKQEIKRIIEE